MSCMDRVILHSDINACYASVEQLYDPSLMGKAVAVGGDAERRHGIILAKSEEAKRTGVKTGMTVWQARQCCPELIVVPPHFERYIYFARKVQEIYADYTDRREPFGIDESWLDVTGCVRAGSGVKCANEIRERVKRELGLTVSVGVSWNKAFAKLGSDYRKPDAVTEITRENYRDIVWRLPVSDLLYVGRATGARLSRMGVRTIGDLAAVPKHYLRSAFGKAGDAVRLRKRSRPVKGAAPGRVQGGQKHRQRYDHAERYALARRRPAGGGQPLRERGSQAAPCGRTM